MFKGTSTAMITPFMKDGALDEENLRKLVEFQEENGVDALVPCGSTGESPLLTHEEHRRVIEIVVDHVKKAKVLAGAGSNSTAEAISLSKYALDIGADGVLSVSPYYVKPTQNGIYQHYKTIAETVDIPIVVYNVPGRTGSNVEPNTLLDLAKISNIVAVKEASGNMAQIEEILEKRPKGFEVLSGDDSITHELICKGAEGVISVTSNCCPKEMSDMVNLSLEGKKEEASKINDMLMPLFKDLFIESNPIPIKYVMGKIGYGNGSPRLPLTTLSENGRSKIDPIMDSLKLRR